MSNNRIPPGIGLFLLSMAIETAAREQAKRRDNPPSTGPEGNICRTATEAAQRDRAAAPIIVPTAVPADFANLHFGERYGIDWQYEEPKPGAEISSDVLFSIESERRRQDQQWGGPGHDDTHGMHEWLGFILKQISRSMDSPMEGHRRMVKIAALAAAALESHKRRAHARQVQKAVDVCLNAAQNPVMPIQRPPTAEQAEQATNGVDSEALHAELSAKSRDDIRGADGVMTAGLAGEAPDVSERVTEAANAFALRVLEYAVKIGDDALSALPPGAFLHVTLGKKG